MSSLKDRLVRAVADKELNKRLLVADEAIDSVLKSKHMFCSDDFISLTNISIGFKALCANKLIESMNHEQDLLTKLEENHEGK